MAAHCILESHAKTLNDGDGGQWSLARCLPATWWTSIGPVATVTASSQHVGRVQSLLSIASRSCVASVEADLAPVVLGVSEVCESI